ncbi:hypothetical protein [Bradyrhizobium tropiciagri]|nr:hypothetical protein [Bradyrhizobium tropiciagri]
MGGVELRIVDVNGQAMPQGEVGEIVCRTPALHLLARALFRFAIPVRRS